jgi:RNA ligase (TIGR02306 family)
MAFGVRILTIGSADPVPNSDRLSVFGILGYKAVSANLDDGSPRFAPGERVVYVPEGSHVPEALLREHGFWGVHPQFQREMGLLSGSNGDVVKPLTLRGQMSTGLLWKLPDHLSHLPDTTDVAGEFGISEWIPPVPAELLAIAMPITAARLNYEIGRLKMYPNLLVGKEVVVTEKLEGECLQMTWLGGDRVEGCHGDGHIAVTTKGLGRQGLAFRDVEAARKVPIIRGMERAGLIDGVKRIVEGLGLRDRKVRILSEAIGGGVKKLHYGEATPTARLIDIRVDQRWLPEDERAEAFAMSGVERAPLLWRGQFDPERIEELRQGQTTLNDKHIREGVVVGSTGEQDKVHTELGDNIRPLLKAHSDAFLKKFGKDD